MKEKIIKIIKGCLIALGVLFLLQILFFSTLFLGFLNLDKITFNTAKKGLSKPKEVQNAINYIEQYKLNNEKYPQNLEGFKVQKGYEYNYELSEDNNCYTLTLKSEKNNLTKRYQHCEAKSDNSTSNSESYIEFNN